MKVSLGCHAARNELTPAIVGAGPSPRAHRHENARPPPSAAAPAPPPHEGTVARVETSSVSFAWIRTVATPSTSSYELVTAMDGSGAADTATAAAAVAVAPT